MNKINFINGQPPALNADTLNQLQTNLEQYKYRLILDTSVTSEETITLPCYYKVGADVLDVYYYGEKLIKAINNDNQGHYYEVGSEGSISNKIRIASDWGSVSAGAMFEFVVRGVWEDETD